MKTGSFALLCLLTSTTLAAPVRLSESQLRSVEAKRDATNAVVAFLPAGVNTNLDTENSEDKSLNKRKGVEVVISTTPIAKPATPAPSRSSKITGKIQSDISKNLAKGTFNIFFPKKEPAKKRDADAEPVNNVAKPVVVVKPGQKTAKFIGGVSKAGSRCLIDSAVC